MITPILHSKDLSIGYPKNSKDFLVVAKDINFELYQGEIIGLLGCNGSGKSTLLKTLGNLLSPVAGSLEIDQTLYTELKAVDFAKKVALVLTEALPTNALTVYQTLALGRQPYTNWLGKLDKEDKYHIQEALNATDTASLQDKYLHQLSDGQLQRVMIARALAQDTPVILLDEPTSHLDIHHKLHIFQLLKEISQQTNKTIIISTHEVNLALKNTERLLLLNNQNLSLGKITEPNIQQELQNMFNSDAIGFDAKTQQFVF